MITAVYVIAIDNFYLYREILLNYLPNEGDYIAFRHGEEVLSATYREIQITHRSDGLLFLESICDTRDLSKEDIEKLAQHYIEYGFIRSKPEDDPVFLYKVEEPESTL